MGNTKYHRQHSSTNHAGTNVQGNGSGGGIYNYGTVTITGSSITENDVGGKEPSGWGLKSAMKALQINADPLLGPLQDNGGPTFTHALLKASPAIDAGDPKFTPPPYYDQRGPDFWRVRNGRIDIGSFEVQAGSTPTATATPRATPTPRPRLTPRSRPTPR